ncbi:hypothetical protein ACFUJR_37705 [Streptomyces sp. NPDC057271]
MSGYSFSLPGWTDGEGAQVWSAASRVSRDLRWAELGETLGSPDPRTAWATPAPATEVAQEPKPAQVPHQPSHPPLTPGQAAAAERLTGVSRARAARARSTTTSTRRTGTTRATGPNSQPPRPPEPPQPRRGRGL